MSDGDTLTVLADGIQHRIRLYGIDSPEHGQAFGQKAKQFTSESAFGKEVTVRIIDVDRYKRLVCRVILPDGKDLSEEVVRAGFAWWYRKYSPQDKGLASLEEAARKGKVGLWADAATVPPWEWRAAKRKAK